MESQLTISVSDVNILLPGLLPDCMPVLVYKDRLVTSTYSLIPGLWSSWHFKSKATLTTFTEPTQHPCITIILLPQCWDFHFPSSSSIVSPIHTLNPVITFDILNSPPITTIATTNPNFLSFQLSHSLPWHTSRPLLLWELHFSQSIGFVLSPSLFLPLLPSHIPHPPFHPQPNLDNTVVYKNYHQQPRFP